MFFKKRKQAKQLKPKNGEVTFQYLLDLFLLLDEEFDSSDLSMSHAISFIDGQLVLNVVVDDETKIFSVILDKEDFDNEHPDEIINTLTALWKDRVNVNDSVDSNEDVGERIDEDFSNEDKDPMDKIMDDIADFSPTSRSTPATDSYSSSDSSYSYTDSSYTDSSYTDSSYSDNSHSSDD